MGAFEKSVEALESFVHSTHPGATLKLAFDEDSGLYEKLEPQIRAYIQKMGYYETHDFWYDGSNYMSEDYICGCVKGASRKGSCWMSPVWQFDAPSRYNLRSRK